MTTETAQLTKQEQDEWTRKLLPNSSRDMGDAAPSQVPGDSNEEAEAGPAGVHAAGKALEGVRFAALSGPGPSGMRPEHLKDALSARARKEHP